MNSLFHLSAISSPATGDNFDTRILIVGIVAAVVVVAMLVLPLFSKRKKDKNSKDDIDITE